MPRLGTHFVLYLSMYDKKFYKQTYITGKDIEIHVDTSLIQPDIMSAVLQDI